MKFFLLLTIVYLYILYQIGDTLSLNLSFFQF